MAIRWVKREDIDNEKLGDIIGEILLKFNSHRKYAVKNNPGRVFSIFWDKIVDEVLGYYSKNK